MRAPASEPTIATETPMSALPRTIASHMADLPDLGHGDWSSAARIPFAATVPPLLGNSAAIDRGNVDGSVATYGPPGSPHRPHLSSPKSLTPTRSPLMVSGRPHMGPPVTGGGLGGSIGGPPHDVLHASSSSAMWPSLGAHTPQQSSPHAVGGLPLPTSGPLPTINGPSVMFPPVSAGASSLGLPVGMSTAGSHMHAESPRGAYGVAPPFSFGSAPYGGGMVAGGASAHAPLQQQQMPAVSGAQQPIGSGRRVASKHPSGGGGDGDWGSAVHDGEFGYHGDG